MFERFGRRSVQATVAGLLAALGVAGIATAQGSGSAAKAPTPAAVKAQAPDPAGPNDKADGATDPAGANDKADAATDPAGANDKADGGAEKPDTESGSEVPGNDGPGGHADEPGNPNANTQQQGQN